ncbi:MAG: glycosyltransferase family 2 protein [Clostridiales bacterium]|nr:glycosyltransferase family 2 protein [Clostridiales bacterium]
MKVLVLLSAYNGEKFIHEQIDSVLNQEGVRVSLLVRDDGSTDKTKEILSSYGDKISFYSGKNIGVRASFFDLILKAGSADFYAFCDQDDFWLPDKLKSACEMMGLSVRPSLYFSNLYTADENLKIMSQTSLKPKLTFGTAMAENPATGCTMVFNRALYEIIKKTPNPAEISMHDTWIYRLALMIGACVFFDKTPHMLYRQHSSNLIGSRSIFAKIYHYVDFFLKNKSFSRPYEAERLLETFGDITDGENILLLNDIINYKSSFSNKLALLQGGRLKTSVFLTNIIVFVSVITGRF